jgi:UDP-2,3-diacylglucosamine pyrophosphatase LpxH
MKNFNLYEFEGVESVVVSGDIHGEFGTMLFRVMTEYSIQNAVVIVAGDCGFGFNRLGYYEGVYRKYQKRLAKNNIYVVFVRGNHDNPEYFKNEAISYKRFRCVPDYSIIKAANHTILCVGGGVSLDRKIRLSWGVKDPSYNDDPLYRPGYYWPDELPVFSPSLLEEIKTADIKPDTIVTHSSPSFCEMADKGPFFFKMTEEDPTLLEDSAKERQAMDDLLSWLIKNNMKPERWIYGHFHRSWHAVIDEVAYSLLDINELKMIY